MHFIATNLFFIFLWVILIIRTPVGRGRTAALMWSTIACSLTAVTTASPDVYAWITQAGGPRAPLTTQSLAMVVGMTLQVCLVRNLCAKSLFPLSLVVIFGFFLILVFAPLITGAQWTSPLGFEDAMLTSAPIAPVWIAQRMAMYTSNLAAMIYTVKFCWRYSRATSGSLSVTLACIGVGCAVSIIFAGIADTFLLLLVANPVLEVPQAIVPLLFVLAFIAALAIFVGYAVEPVTRTTMLIRSWRALESMWSDLVEVMPDIAFPSLRWGIGGEYGITLQDRLYRRVMEIKDGIYALRENLPSGVLASSVSDDTSAAGREFSRVEAEAAWLVQAVDNCCAGIRYGSSAEPLNRGGMSYDEEVAWLRRLARAYRNIRENSPPQNQVAPSRST